MIFLSQIFLKFISFQFIISTFIQAFWISNCHTFDSRKCRCFDIFRLKFWHFDRLFIAYIVNILMHVKSFIRFCHSSFEKNFVFELCLHDDWQKLIRFRFLKFISFRSWTFNIFVFDFFHWWFVRISTKFEIASSKMIFFIWFEKIENDSTCYNRICCEFRIRKTFFFWQRFVVVNSRIVFDKRILINRSINCLKFSKLQNIKFCFCTARDSHNEMRKKNITAILIYFIASWLSMKKN